jgi:protein phosphatase 1 regulatory subunit 3A/B/C/D/E
LENVIIRDYSLVGTIKVKNVAFQKSVFVRCTFDSWESSQDFAATFVPNGSSASVYDTFAFEIRVPPTFDVRKKIQFCICYCVNNTEYWDSHNGSNYEVVSSDWKDHHKIPNYNTTDTTVYSLSGDSNWSQFSGWENMDSSCPYW